MATVYAVASSKGGVGKTTTTANLGATLASAGLSVAVVDGDIGMANLGDALGVDPDGATLHDVLAGTADVEDAVYEGPAGLAVVPGDTSIDGFRAADPENLAGVLDGLAEYDYVLVDTGAGLSHDTVLPLGLADEVVLVSTTERDSLTDTEKTRQVVDRLGGTTRGVVLTCVDPDDPNAAAVAERLSADVIEAIPVDPVVRESMRLSDPLATHAPASAAASAYRALAAGLTGESVPTPEAVDEADATTDGEGAKATDGEEAETTDGGETDTAGPGGTETTAAEAAQDDADTEETDTAESVTLDAPAAAAEDDGITLTEPDAGESGESEGDATSTDAGESEPNSGDDIEDHETVEADDSETDEADDAETAEADDTETDETDAETAEADDTETGDVDDAETVETETGDADDASGLTDDDALAADTEPSDDPLVADSAGPDAESSTESETDGEPVFTTSLVEEAEPTDGRTDDGTDERETTSDAGGDVDLVETDDEEEDDDGGRGFLGRLLG